MTSNSEIHSYSLRHPLNLKSSNARPSKTCYEFTAEDYTLSSSLYILIGIKVRSREDICSLRLLCILRAVMPVIPLKNRSWTAYLRISNSKQHGRSSWNRKRGEEDYDKVFMVPVEHNHQLNTKKPGEGCQRTRCEEGNALGATESNLKKPLSLLEAIPALL